MDDIRTHTLIIGCGIAGAAAALALSDNPNLHVTVITRAVQAADCNTGWAQGGIVTRGLDDSPDLLVEDILRAGAGLSLPLAARILAEEGPRHVRSVLMERCAVNFDRDENGEIVYGLEAAHSTRRIVHVGDKTGAAIIDAMLDKRLRCPTTPDQSHGGSLITFLHHSLDPLDIFADVVTAPTCPARHGEVIGVIAVTPCWQLAAWGRFSATRPIRAAHAAMAWRWPGVRARAWSMRSTFNFIPRR
jgi:L-aspartate oxidase